MEVNAMAPARTRDMSRRVFGIKDIREDFTGYDYQEMRDEIIGTGPGRFSLVFPVGEDGERQIRLNGQVEAIFHEDGDGYVTPYEEWYEALIRLESYECRSVAYEDGKTLPFEGGALACCSFDAGKIDGYTEEMDWKTFSNL